MKINSLLLLSILALMPMLDVAASYPGRSRNRNAKSSGNYGNAQTSGTTSGSKFGSSSSANGSINASSSGAGYGSKQTSGTTSGSSSVASSGGSYGNQQNVEVTSGSKYGSGITTGSQQQKVQTSGYQQVTTQQGTSGNQQQTAQRGRDFSGHHERFGRHGELAGGGYRTVGGYQAGSYAEAGLIGTQLATRQVEATPVVYRTTEAYAPVVGTVQTYAPAVQRAVETYSPVVARTIETVAQADTYAPLVTGIRTVLAKNTLIRGKAERGFTPFRLCSLQQEFYNRSFLGHTWEWWFDNYFPFFIGVFPFLFHAEYKVFPPLYTDYFNVFGAYPRPIENFDQFVNGVLPWPAVEEAAAPLTTNQVVRQVQTVPVQGASRPYAREVAAPSVPQSVYSGGFFRG